MSYIINPYRYEEGLLTETTDYITRVEADGGEVIDENYVNEAYKLLTRDNISSGYAWLSASFGLKKDGSNNVSKLYSLSGSDYDVEQTTSSKQPLYSTGLGYPSIIFDGTDDEMPSISAQTISQDNYVIAGLKWDDISAGNNFYFDGRFGGARQTLYEASSSATAFAGTALQGATTLTNSEYIISILFDSTTSEIWLDQVSDATGDTSTNNLTYINIGNRPGFSFYFQGQFVDLFIVEDTTISRTDYEDLINTKMGTY